MGKERLNNQILVPQRLREARLAQGKSIKEVAENLGISAQVLSMYELGRCKPSIEVFFRLRIIYELPTSFFYMENENGISRGQTYFRSFAAATKSSRDTAFVKSEWFAKIIFNELSIKVNFPPVDQLFFKIKESKAVEKNDRDMETLAKLIRREWKLGTGPIENLTRLLERKGVLVVKMDLDETIDGFSFWEWKLGRPFIFVNTNNNPFRLRMSIAHELCHLFFHDGSDLEKQFKELESEAKYFANAFLLPESSFKNDIISTSLERLLYLKPKWGVSLQAMLMRCEHLRLISDERFVYLQKQISRKKWRKNEPGDDAVNTEKPILMCQAVKLLIEHGVFSKERFLELLPFNQNFIEEACFLPAGYLSTDDNIVNINSMRK